MVVNLAIVGVQAVRDKIRQAVNKRVKFRSRVTRGNARASHPDFEIDQDRNGLREPDSSV